MQPYVPFATQRNTITGFQGLGRGRLWDLPLQAKLCISECSLLRRGSWAVYTPSGLGGVVPVVHSGNFRLPWAKRSKLWLEKAPRQGDPTGLGEEARPDGGWEALETAPGINPDAVSPSPPHKSSE